MNCVSFTVSMVRGRSSFVTSTVPKPNGATTGICWNWYGLSRRCCAGVELQDRLVLRATRRLLALVDGRADAAADGVLVVERPPVEEVDVVAAVHPRAGPHRDLVVGALRVEVADADRLLGLAAEVEERREERERRDDAALHALAPLVLATELELGVAAFVDDARTERDDVRAAASAAAQIACSIHASVRAELEAALVLGGRFGDDARRLVAAAEPGCGRAGNGRARSCRRSRAHRCVKARSRAAQRARPRSWARARARRASSVRAAGRSALGPACAERAASRRQRRQRSEHDQRRQAAHGASGN